MKTGESRHTLVVADLQWKDTQNQGESALENQLNEISANAVRVGRGMFLFDTRQDCERIYQLLALLRIHNRKALILPIETELHILCGKLTSEAISKRFQDLSLYRTEIQET